MAMNTALYGFPRGAEAVYEGPDPRVVMALLKASYYFIAQGEISFSE
jgi:hypothetical protein